jgi:hypothetical protein
LARSASLGTSVAPIRLRVVGFNIKSMGPNRGPNAKTQQGYFPINECRKYRGGGPIVFRSSWEKQFMLYCERNKDVVWWASEPCSIPYHNPFDGKMHEYFVDFLLKMSSGAVLLVEVKPKFQLVPPNPPKNRGPKTSARYQRDVDTYRTNMLKVAAARAFAAARGMKYLLVTEDFFRPTQ